MVTRPSDALQYLATFSCSFSVISSGINLGWTSPYLPKLLADDSPIPTTNEEGIWCACMALIGAPLGALFAALTLDKIGRKWTILVMAPITLASMVLTAFSNTIILISLARFIMGAVEGGLYTAVPIYIAEISRPGLRGVLSSTIDIASILGTLFINALGPFTSIHVSSLVCTVVPLVHLITFLWMPESPYYLIMRKRILEAEESLKLLRGHEEVKAEIQELILAVERQEGKEKPSFKDLLSVRSNRKAVWVFVILNMTNKFSGNNPFIFYTSTIFASAGTQVDPVVSVLGYCCVRLVGTMLSLFVVDKFGRRPLMIFSAGGCAVFLLLEGAYFFLLENSSYFFPSENSCAIQSACSLHSWNWLPITALFGYNLLYSFGLSFGPVLYLGELFPTNMKAAALGFGDTFSVTMGTIASKFFQAAMDEVGLWLPFWVFAGCCLIGVLLIIRYVPETKGKTLEEIQLMLIGEDK